jgi:hypothetical protein
LHFRDVTQVGLVDDTLDLHREIRTGMREEEEEEVGGGRRRRGRRWMD